MSKHTKVTVDELDATGADAVDDDLPTLLRRREHARPNRVTWILLALLLVGAGFVGGAYANQRFGATTSGGLPSGFPAGMPIGTSVQGAATPFGDMTVGTVKLVDKQNLYVTTTAGDTVKVSVPETATVTSQQEITLADLEAGTTVIVRGTTADDGTVTAESVSEGSLPGGMPGAPTTSDSSTTGSTTSSTPSTPTTEGEN
jgi:hypothetical protein